VVSELLAETERSRKVTTAVARFGLLTIGSPLGLSLRVGRWTLFDGVKRNLAGSNGGSAGSATAPHRQIVADRAEDDTICNGNAGQ